MDAKIESIKGKLAKIDELIAITLRKKNDKTLEIRKCTQEVCLASKSEGSHYNECMELKTIILDMVYNRRINHILGPHTILVCDQVKLGMPITNNILIHCYDTTFAESYLNIYYKLVQRTILSPTKRKENIAFAL
ncbi:hypothetical protein H5410_041280 [Solanum commersonii]|uniref:Uncharacterized protein n=1 Tax=Solanum commersonii TaxID=4109 RepID=A0A9J5XV11_SOLCO|nr:hypothetical protein H5410_041280 [Solanum commersonii]